MSLRSNRSCDATVTEVCTVAQAVRLESAEDVYLTQISDLKLAHQAPLGPAGVTLEVRADEVHWLIQMQQYQNSPGASAPPLPASLNSHKGQLVCIVHFTQALDQHSVPVNTLCNRCLPLSSPVVTCRWYHRGVVWLRHAAAARLCCAPHGDKLHLVALRPR